MGEKLVPRTHERSELICFFFFFLSFGISEYIWSVSNILCVKNHQYFDYLAPLGIQVFDLDYTDVNF